MNGEYLKKKKEIEDMIKDAEREQFDIMVKQLKEQEEQEINVVIVDKIGRELIEEFMGYVEGYLSNHIRWNDIMPVVSKIEITNRKHDNEYYPYMVTIWKARCEISDGNNGHIVARGYTENDKIKAVYLAILQFINWYNLP